MFRALSSPGPATEYRGRCHESLTVSVQSSAGQPVRLGAGPGRPGGIPHGPRQDRRHRHSSTRPHPVRARNDQLKVAEKISMAAKVRPDPAPAMAGCDEQTGDRAYAGRWAGGASVARTRLAAGCRGGGARGRATRPAGERCGGGSPGWAERRHCAGRATAASQGRPGNGRGHSGR